MDFYSQISKYYNDIFPLNKAQISFVTSYLNQRGSIGSMLDIGCGTGGLSIGLHNYFDVISAIDTNEEMLKIARAKASGKNIDFTNMSMMEIDKIFPYNAFNIVLCFGNTVVHLQSIEEIELFFNNVATILVEGGKFLFQIINYDNVLDNKLSGLPTIENDRIKFERKYLLNENNMIDFSTILTIKDTGEEIVSSVVLFPIRKIEVEQTLKNAGFKNIKSYSSFTKKEYSRDSLPLIFECY
ncbi:MAG: class I SAM-dependent methyltransferase [Bacteroidota bacterium]